MIPVDWLAFLKMLQTSSPHNACFWHLEDGRFTFLSSPVKCCLLQSSCCWLPLMQICKIWQVQNTCATASIHVWVHHQRCKFFFKRWCCPVRHQVNLHSPWFNFGMAFPQAADFLRQSLVSPTRWSAMPIPSSPPSASSAFAEVEFDLLREDFLAKFERVHAPWWKNHLRTGFFQMRPQMIFSHHFFSFGALVVLFKLANMIRICRFLGPELFLASCYFHRGSFEHLGGQTGETYGRETWPGNPLAVF